MSVKRSSLDDVDMTILLQFPMMAKSVVQMDPLVFPIE